MADSVRSLHGIDHVVDRLMHTPWVAQVEVLSLDLLNRSRSYARGIGRALTLIIMARDAPGTQRAHTFRDICQAATHEWRCVHDS
ncbi:MAG: hypothetical protein AAGI30_02600 [Planctomycetota bacterium]